MKAGCLLLLLLGTRVWAHPVSDYFLEWQLQGDALVAVLSFTLDDVQLAEQLQPAFNLHLTPEQLATGLEAFRARAVAGLQVFDAGGVARSGEDLGLLGSLPRAAIGLEELEDYRLQLRILFPAAVVAVSDAVAFDFGAWRRGVSASIKCRSPAQLSAVPLVLWHERFVYPLRPSGGQPSLVDGQAISLVEPLQSLGTAFMYLYPRPDQLRLEILIPLANAVSSLPPELLGNFAEPLSPAARKELARHYQHWTGQRRGIGLDAAPQVPVAQHLEFFSRSGLRRGLPSPPEQVPVATGYVGLQLLYQPADSEIEVLTADLGDWQFQADRVVVGLIDDGRVVERFSLDQQQQLRWRLPQPAAEVPPSPPLSAAPPWSLWALAAGLVLCLALCLGSREMVGLAALVLLVALLGQLRTPPALAPEAVEELLRHCYRAAADPVPRRALRRLRSVCTEAAATEFFLASRRQLAGPWHSRDGLQIDAIQLQSLTGGGRRVQASWQVACRINHWGHQHRRLTGFIAGLGFATDGRLQAVDLLAKEQLGASAAPVASD